MIPVSLNLKIWTLRDIISDLEVQVATKAEEAASVFAQNKALNEMVEQQGQTQLQLAQEVRFVSFPGFCCLRFLFYCVLVTMLV